MKTNKLKDKSKAISNSFEDFSSIKASLAEKGYTLQYDDANLLGSAILSRTVFENKNTTVTMIMEKSNNEITTTVYFTSKEIKPAKKIVDNGF